MLDEHGDALVSDLLREFGVNVLDTLRMTGESPAFILICVNALPDNSLYAAEVRGGYEYYGWGMDRILAANIHDILTLHLRAVTGSSEEDFPFWPMPGRESAQTQKPKTSLASLHAKLLGGSG